MLRDQQPTTDNPPRAKVMAWLRKFQMRLRAQFAKRKLDAELDEEMRSHIEMQTQENIANGMPPEEARYAALRQFGHVEGVKEACRDRREGFVGRQLSVVGRDIRFALRQLRRSPGFTAVAVLTLALGIGATTAIVSVVRTALFDPLPVQQPENYLALAARDKERDWLAPGLNAVAAREVEANTNLFQRVVLWENDALTLESGTFPQRLDGLKVTGDLFSLFSVAPRWGRLPGSDDATRGAERVVVLSHSAWRTVFGGDPSVIGRTVRFKEGPATVIGIMPAHFSFPYRYNDYWRPWAGPEVQAGDVLRSGRSESLANTGIIAELREESSLAQVQAFLDVIQARQAQEDRMQTQFRFEAIELREKFAKPELRRTLWALTAATALVLLIASANLANLQLARTEARQQELAVRSALGGGRARVFRQLLSESLLLALLGGLAGLFVTISGLELLTRLLPPGLPRLKEIELDRGVLGIAMLVTMATGVLFGIIPAWRGGRLNVSATLKLGAATATAGPGRAWFTRSLVVGQIALTFVLLCGAGLMVRTVNKLLSVDVGFDPQRLVKVYPRYDMDAVNRFLTSAEGMNNADAYVTAIYEDLHQRLSGLPGVEAVGIARPGRSGQAVTAPNAGEVYQLNEYRIGVDEADPLRAMRAGLVAGRWLTASDAKSANLAVLINESAARQLWPGETAEGKRFWLKRGDQEESFRVAGVIKDLRENAYNEEPEPTFYRPGLDAMSLFGAERALVVRTSVPYAALRPAVERELKAAGAGHGEPIIRFVDEELYAETAGHRTFMRYLLFFAGLALLLAAIGLYGVLAYSVARRTREIGIRVAVGAQRSDVLRLILRQGLMLALLGTAVGTAGALAATQALRPFLFGVPAHDPMTLIAMIGVLAVTALFACWLPALRAARVDPMTALRTE